MKSFVLGLMSVGFVSATGFAVEPPCRTATAKVSTTHTQLGTIPKIAAGAGSFKTLITALVATDLLGALEGDGPFLVFAPTDEAFAKLPKGTLEKLLKDKEKLATILKYHVVPNKNTFNAHGHEGSFGFKTLEGRSLKVSKDSHGLKVNNATIQIQNIMAKNGSIQVIDTVLMPPEEAATSTIPAVAEKAGLFKTLLAAVKTAELAEVLSGPGPFTVFAPTDDAFAKLPKGTVEKLLKPENRAQLVAILKLHVIAGSRDAKTLASYNSLDTLGGKVSFEIRDGRLTVNDSAIIKSDIKADNGIIHVIDTVLLPGR
ncbi:MAG: fasciclin domain-containing protein [Fimbriiglobus sp.]